MSSCQSITSWAHQKPRLMKVGITVVTLIALTALGAGIARFAMGSNFPVKFFGNNWAILSVTAGSVISSLLLAAGICHLKNSQANE